MQSSSSSQDLGARIYRRHTVYWSLAFIIVQTKACWIAGVGDCYFCAFCQTHVEFWRKEINAEFGGNFDMPVVYYCEFTSVTRRRNAENTALEGRFKKVKNLEEIAAK